MNHTVQEVTLKNGLKGLVLNAPDANVVSLEISFRAGEFLLERNKWETAHLLEHVMLGKTEGYESSRAFQADIEKNGAYSNASTSSYDVAYEIECAAFEAERVIGLMCHALMHPSFTAAEFKAEFGNVNEELVLRSNNHFRTLNIALHESLGFYTVNDHDRAELMSNVTLADIKAHYGATHSIENARFVIAGPVTDKHVHALEKLQLPSQTARIAMPQELPKILHAPVVIDRDVPNLYFYIDTYATRVLSLKERDALSIVSTLLTDSLHSQLLGAAREQGLVYAMGSGQQHTKDVSNFWLGAQVSKKNAPALFDLTQKVFNDIKHHGISEDELHAAQQYMEGKHARTAQTVSALASAYAPDYYNDDTIVPELSYVECIRAVTVADVQQVLHTITEGTWALGLLGKVDDELADELYKKTDRVLHL